eukprot:3159458-Prymnesium_polylepis.1
MPTRRGTFSRPCVGRDARKGQGEISGAEQSAPELGVIPDGARKASPKSGTHICCVDCAHLSGGDLGGQPQPTRHSNSLATYGFTPGLQTPLSTLQDPIRNCAFPFPPAPGPRPFT